MMEDCNYMVTTQGSDSEVLPMGSCIVMHGIVSMMGTCNEQGGSYGFYWNNACTGVPAMDGAEFADHTLGEDGEAATFAFYNCDKASCDESLFDLTGSSSGSGSSGPSSSGSGSFGSSSSGSSSAGSFGGSSSGSGSSSDDSSAEEVCEGHGYGEQECSAFGCCAFDEGECWAQDGPCNVMSPSVANTTPENNVSGKFKGLLSAGLVAALTLAVCMI